MSEHEHTSEIPTVDLAALVHHERRVREETTASIRQGFGAYGLVYLENHGVDVALRDRLFSRFVELIERPESETAALLCPDLWFQRGIRRADGSSAQFLAAPRGIEPALAIQYPETCAASVWPEGMDGFEEDCVSLGQQLHEAGLSLLQGVAMGLRIAERTFDRRLEGAPHLLRLLRQSDGWGSEEADASLLTLWADDGSGTLVQTRDGVELHVEAPEGCIVAHVGQQLEIVTGGELLATRRSVAAPDEESARVSAAHLMVLHCHQMVFPFERFRTDETIRAYSPPVLAGTYATKTLVDRGLAPANALDELGHRTYLHADLSGEK